ncbi:MAG: hypothetical protein U0R80_20390 [Nocardioidaceae bacterium]
MQTTQLATGVTGPATGATARPDPRIRDPRIRDPRSPSLARHLAASLPGRLFLVLWAGLAAAGVGAATGAPAVVTGSSVLLVAAVSAWRLTPTGALVVAGVAWLVLNGFVENTAGRLAVSDLGDVWWLLAVVATTLLAGHRR